MTRREESALARISYVIAGWLMAIAAFCLIQSLDQQDAQAEQQHAERQARAERADTFEQLDAKACQMTACDRIGK